MGRFPANRLSPRRAESHPRGSVRETNHDPVRGGGAGALGRRYGSDRRSCHAFPASTPPRPSCGRSSEPEAALSGETPTGSERHRGSRQIVRKTRFGQGAGIRSRTPAVYLGVTRPPGLRLSFNFAPQRSQTKTRADFSPETGSSCPLMRIECPRNLRHAEQRGAPLGSDWNCLMMAQKYTRADVDIHGRDEPAAVALRALFGRGPARVVVEA